MLNSKLFKYFVYYPVTLAKGERVAYHLPAYRRQQYLRKEDLSDYQRKHLLRLLQYASTHSAHYRGRLDDSMAAIQSGRSPQEALALAPFLTKADLISERGSIATPRRFWSSKKTTGGSTGEPVTLLKNPDALARERAATWRSYEWAGVSIGDVQARFWGVPHSKIGRRKAQLTDLLSNRVRISAFALKQDNIESHYARLQSLRPKYLYGYVSAIAVLARYINECGLNSIDGVRAVITTSEILSPGDRRLIATAFQAPVFNEYGCGEVGSVAHECEHGTMHTMSDNLIVEIDKQPTQRDFGELVVTDLFNFATPLIRYRLGDYSFTKETQCPCGRTLPAMGDIRGRAYDLVRLKDGQILHPEALMYILESVQQRTGAFRQFQVVQESLDRFTVRVVPNGSISSQVINEVSGAFRHRVSPTAEVLVVQVTDIPREPSGKMRVVKSQVNHTG